MWQETNESICNSLARNTPDVLMSETRSADNESFKLLSLSDRPDLLAEFMEFDEFWPAFMLEDPYGRLLGRLGLRFASTVFVVEEAGKVVGRAIAVPVPWSVDDELPARGWDAAIEAAIECAVSGAPARSLCALEITLHSSTRGRGVSKRVVSLLREHARSLSLESLLAPVRPTGKSDHMNLSMADYLATDPRPEGLPVDPWLRIHMRLGAEIVGIAPTSMVIAGSFDEWHGWSGVDLSTVVSNQAELSGALVPLSIDHVNHVATYVEPNVWCRHRLDAPERPAGQ